MFSVKTIYRLQNKFEHQAVTPDLLRPQFAKVKRPRAILVSLKFVGVCAVMCPRPSAAW